ncbi:ANTAR domain-containing response regulator [Crassaminicella thermophila]|uniref:Stage 0 sporulation protein A homolog n=1 Tax=Crassaminicella thermophila TaxID=2599308 RepID=A0A5C0SEA3_CRATE|nr:ANTAR domain-containing response regulator [Crassaminicella thermophila]QEK12651.1 ANTAR domain-containing response regulator [Crassaminicella thermophila]
MKKRIVIADDEPITRMDLCEILEEAGYDVVGKASDGFDAVELCRKFKPDLVLMDVKMPLLNGLKATEIINEEQLANCVILLTAYSGKEFIEEAKNLGVMGYLVKPVNEKILLPTIEVCFSKSKEIERIKNDAKKAKEHVENRKIIERAKGILIKNYGITEDEAYKRIRKLSMDKRCPMKDIANAIIINCM